MDNNAAEQNIRGFCWGVVDNVHGAKASTIICSISETARVNNLTPYKYFEYLLIGIPQHLDETSVDFCKDLLPWSDELPEKWRK